MGRHLRLSTQTLLLQLGIVALTLLVVLAAWFFTSRAELVEQYGERALAIADAVAALPSVAESLDEPDPTATLQPLGEAVRTASGMSFVVITDRDGVRMSHPDPAELGQRVSTDPSAPLAGQRTIEVDTGTLGRSVRGKSPILGADGDVIGIVSVGVLQAQVTAQFVEGLPTAVLFVVPALALGIAGSLLLARRIKRLTFGLEPYEIAALLEQREAMLHGIREGVVALDRDGRLVLVNDEAARLLELPARWSGKRPDEVLPDGKRRALLSGTEQASDAVLLVGGKVLLANRMPVDVRDERVGTVVTVRDRTELEDLSRELDSLRDAADALRAQAHEFTNRLHTIAGLIELGHHDEAVSAVTEAALGHQRLAESVAAQVRDPALAALLLVKAAVAAERRVELSLTGDSLVARDLADPHPALTIVGNLVDNALDAVTSTAGGGRIEVRVRVADGALSVRVADSGPGFDPADAERLFEQGYSTKGGPHRRGLGLAMVRQTAQRRGGTYRVHNDGGAVFEVHLPLPHAAWSDAALQKSGAP